MSEILLAIVAGLILGTLVGFMTIEFIMRPVMLLARWGATLLGTIFGWGRRLP